MIIQEGKLNGIFIITLQPRIDDRGFFMRSFDLNILRENGLDRPWVQENHSRSMQKGIIRGLHLQVPPYGETKLIRCIRGRFLDVFADLRKDSSTFGQWGSVELSEDNYKMIFIPRGFAHGFCTLSNISEALYKVDNFYSPAHEIGIIWNDPDLAVTWPVPNPVLSEKDKNNMTFKEFVDKFGGIKTEA
jgi:dTDP-4-dehydrorhamnose 3,5-epimerase